MKSLERAVVVQRAKYLSRGLVIECVVRQIEESQFAWFLCEHAVERLQCPPVASDVLLQRCVREFVPHQGERLERWHLPFGERVEKPLTSLGPNEVPIKYKRRE